MAVSNYRPGARYCNVSTSINGKLTTGTITIVRTDVNQTVDQHITRGRKVDETTIKGATRSVDHTVYDHIGSRNSLDLATKAIATTGCLDATAKGNRTTARLELKKATVTVDTGGIEIDELGENDIASTTNLERTSFETVGADLAAKRDGTASQRANPVKTIGVARALAVDSDYALGTHVNATEPKVAIRIDRTAAG